MYDIRKDMSDEMLAFIDATVAEQMDMFESAVARHDVTYEYSDDHSMWRRGSAERNIIRSMATYLPTDFVNKVWNERMDKTFTADEAPRWYWR